MLMNMLKITGILCLAGLLFSTAHAEDKSCNKLDCLLCPAIDNPQSYPEGNMQLMHMLTPGNDRWLFRSDIDLTNSFGMSTDNLSGFTRLVQEFSSQGIELAMVIQPTRGLMHRDKVRDDYMRDFNFELARENYVKYLGQLRKAGAIVPDLTQLIDNPPADEYFFRRDHHWTSAGAMVTAKLVADELIKHPIYELLPRKKFQTRIGNTQFKDGTLNLALNSLCGNNYGFQYVPGYTTIPEIDNFDQLFDDEPDPEVILVGTSNSASRDAENKQFNFDGFLKDYLRTDLLNFAMPGAGEFGSLIEYLNSTVYSNTNPPRLIIWELPANYQPGSELMYRQLIPAIRGQCSDDSLLFNSVKRIGISVDERIELLNNTGLDRKDLRNLTGGYLDIRTNNRNFKNFYLLIYYDNGQRDKIWIRREAVVSGGQFYLELSDMPEFRNSNLLSVFIEPTEDHAVPTTMEVRLCQ